MKYPKDKTTTDFLKKTRGRPVTGLALSDAERKALQRKRMDVPLHRIDYQTATLALLLHALERAVKQGASDYVCLINKRLLDMSYEHKPDLSP